jgi:hypothetical protein
MKKPDQGQLIADITSLRELFGPILERERQELLRLQKEPPNATLEDAWALRQEAHKAREQIRGRIARIFGWSVLEGTKLTGVLQRDLKERPDLMQSVETLWQGFHNILEAIPDCEHALAPAYFQNFCGELEAKLKQIDEDLLRVKNASPDTQSKEIHPLNTRVISAIDNLKMVIGKATHTRLESFWEGYGFRSVLEGLLDGQPELFARVDGLTNTAFRIRSELSTLRRNIRQPQTAVSNSNDPSPRAGYRRPI